MVEERGRDIKAEGVVCVTLILGSCCAFSAHR